jgi:hypothetical protein
MKFNTHIHVQATYVQRQDGYGFNGIFIKFQFFPWWDFYLFISNRNN